MQSFIQRSANKSFIFLFESSMFRTGSFAFALLLTILSVATAASASSLNDRMEKFDPMETKVLTEAAARKERSEILLSAEGVPINKTLPVIETERESKLRSKDEIAYRAMALLVVAVKGDGLEQATVERIVRDYDLESHFTPKERSFINNKLPSEHDRVQFSWRYEAAWTLLWSLGYVDRLDKPNGICDVPRAVRFMQEKKSSHYALNWLISYMGQEWDDISCDT